MIESPETDPHTLGILCQREHYRSVNKIRLLINGSETISYPCRKKIKFLSQNIQKSKPSKTKGEYCYIW